MSEEPPGASLLSTGVDPARLRAEFPVLARLAFLNTGTDGPVPSRAMAAVRAEVERQAAGGRTRDHSEHRFELQARQRAAYAERRRLEDVVDLIVAETGASP